MRIIWVRHGETDGNRARKYIGHTDIPLNEIGHKQAEALAKRLAKEPVRAIYTSDLLRAQQSAQKLLAYFPDIFYEATPLLRECFFGEWEGLTYLEICEKNEAHFQKWYEDPFRHAPPQGETLVEMDKRLSRCLKQIETKHHPQDCIAIFTHGGPLRWAWAKLVECRWKGLWKAKTPNAGGWILEKEDKGWKLIEKIELDGVR
ncbi:histidine phosphatase family protein [Thermoflavimicrobium dichotomicum]|uniref:Alpha-ribazole phosphatase n=1 Tax=Thermoflavimicrobium dichotomicum TaxID=46223 RepID=A0A1I3MHX4_9BACL|nr:histidine phosphatase family protein [Thermoflavimicrobium dichotomicum]SFI96573.1 alpha-ribazole phosphatase [Thermoflavimicrobium dichotomicum]